MNPQLYGPNGRLLPPRDVDINSTHREARKIKLAIRQAKRLLSNVPKLWRSTSSRVLALATLLGIVVLYPRVSIAPGNDLGSRDPLHLFITVTNNGQFSIYSATLSCNIDVLENLTTHNFVTRVASREPVDLPIGTLAGGGYTTTMCPSMVAMVNPGDKFYGHATFFISFRPSFWPRHISRTFYMQGNTETDGQLHWYVVSK